jgi:DNA-binding NarL/FixJ family response regulator
MSSLTETDRTPPIHLVLVDDDEVDVLALRRAFRAQGIANPMHVADDGLAALDLLRGDGRLVDKPYIVLLDLNMPRMNGIEFLKEVRKDPDLRDSIVFVFSTSDDQADIGDAYDLNVAGYVVKSRVDASLDSLTNLLQQFWQVVELPK